MRRFLLVLAVLTALVFALSSCGGSKKENVYDYPDEDSTDTDSEDDLDSNDLDISDLDISDADSDNPQEPEDHDIPETPDETPDNDIPEVTENHKISGIYQISGNVSGIEAALYECGGTEKIASADTDSKGKYSFNADISASKTYCVKAGNFASCFKGMSDHVANISEITNAVLLVDPECSDLRKSEIEVRAYAKLGTGEWLGELDYSKLSGIKEGLKLLASYLNTNDSKTLSEKIAADVKNTDGREFQKFFNGFKVSTSTTEIVIGETADNNALFTVEGGSSKISDGFKIKWSLKNQTGNAATYKFATSTPGEYTARAKLVYDGRTMGGDPIMFEDGGDPIMLDAGGDPIMLSEDFASVLFLGQINGGTVYVSDNSKNISFRIDDGIYGVIPKGVVVKKNGKKINSISYEVLSSGGSQVSRIKFYPEGTTFEGDSMYFVHELGTVFGGDPIMLSATRTNADGTVDVLNSAAGDPIMMAAGGDPIMTTAAGDPIMQAAAGDPIMNSAAGDPIMTAAAGDPIMNSAAGDPIMTSAAGDPIMNAAAGDPIMTSAAGDPIMTAAAGDPIMMGTSSSTMISQTSHYSTFTVEAAYLPVSVETLAARWCDGSFYHGYSPIEFIRLGFQTYKPESTLLPYLNCEKFAYLGSDLYELMNKQIGFQRNLNLFENLFFVSEFYNRMNAKRENGTYVAVKNGLELRSAIAALYTATTSYNRSSNVADLFDSSKIPLTYNGSTPADYSAEAKSALTGNSGSSDRYAATKKEMMIFANYITTSKGPDFSSVSSVLTPDQLICAWFNPDTLPQNCSKVYTLNSAGHVTLGGTEVSVAEANAVFTKFFMPMNSRLDNEEKLSLFRTFYLALKYAGTIFYNGSDVEELNGALLKTAYLVFDGIDGNANAVTITDTFDASAHTVAVLDGAEMATRPYIQKLSALTDLISLKVAAESANVEKVVINIEGYEFEKVQENTRTYYTPKGNLKEKSIVLTPGTLSQGEKALKELLGSENIDELGNITGKMTIVANSKISGKTYTTQKSYDFFVNNDSDGVNSKPVPANIQIFVNDSTGHAIAANANPTVILNPGNKVYYPTNGVVSIENLTPAAYTVDAFADGYYAKSTSVNVPAGAAFGVEIRLDEELTSTADASLELKVNIATAKHPSKVYIQIYNDDMDLVANEAAKFNNETDTYNKVNVEINSGRYTLLAVGEDLYNYLEAITLYEGANTKEITVVAKNACGNGIVDSAEECEPALAAPVSCGTIYPASTHPENNASCDPNTCTFNKTECGKAAYCGDGIIDRPSEACDGGSKDCSEIAGFGSSSGSAPCASDCSGYITANNCSKATESCGNLPANALWNDGLGTFRQTYNGTSWLPATKTSEYGTTKDECVFSCIKGYKWNGSQCLENPVSLGLICTGADSCFDNTNEGECPAYGVVFFGQDAQYAENGYCTPHKFTLIGSGENQIVKANFTHYEWQAASSGNVTWAAAETYCSRLENGSSTAVWRVPTPAELLTIIDSSNASPALDNNYFTVSGYNFWASEDKKNTKNAWRVTTSGALMSVAKTTKNYVLCVRVHDYDAAENRFTATDETVKDSVSGLMWQKQAVASRTWAEALNYCEEVSTADKYDWRLPNRNELASLVDYTKTSGAMSDFPSIAAKAFWTSTTKINENANAWTVNFESGSIESANKADTKYIICVRNDEPCFGDECPNVCGFNACKGMANSTGLCTANDYSFTCGCKSGFNWNHGKCLLDTTRYTACTGLPENAIWNTVFGISQTYDGDKWYPSETGSFNKIASSTECRFICATNYKWDADEEKCLPVSRMTNCSEKKPYSDWNVVSKISQTWDGEKWQPSAESVYNTESSEEECRFICKEHYNWDSENNICDGETQPATCIGLPANAHWWNDPASITQKWTNGGWAPAATGRYNDAQADNECYFGCDENYEWNGTACAAKKQTASCEGLPDNAEWTGEYSTVQQTWNGSEWVPGTIGTYNTEANSNYCRFKCKANYNWNGSSCVAATQLANCTGLPANAQWNTVSSITQTYMLTGENTYGWSPSNVGSYSSDETLAECHFICRENYEWINNECTGRKQIVECAGLPANAAWKDGQSAVEQTWSGSQGWLPSAVGQHNAAAGCSFECNTNYTWNASTKTCNGAKRNNQACTGLPANAQWNGSSTIQQTWNGSDWLPALNGTYSENAVTNECHFKCRNNYNWTGSTCEAKTQIVTCGTLPVNAAWNSVSQIKQTWNGSTEKWEPAVNLVYSETSSETECRYSCKENYEFKNSQCTAKKQTAACTGLPANAVWNSATVEQTWNGTIWAPATAGTHTTGSATDKCYFKCIAENDQYVWSDSEKACVGRTKTGQACTGLKEHAHWNEYSQISQTWNGEAWLPSTTGSYSTTTDSKKCYFSCDDNYQWNGSECVAAKQIASCGTLPANAQWNTVSSIEQTWTQNGWQPDSTPAYGNASTEECRYTCKANFKWENSQCVPKEQDDQNCTGLPANAEWWNGVTSVKQHWDEVEHAWLPTTTGIHATSGADNQCRFRCIDEGNKYKWENNACVANTKTGQSCTGIPAHAHWNGQYSQISQTWNGSEWFPSTTGTYSTATDETRCYFSCDENYQWNGSECVAKTQIANCGTLPSHAVWNTVSKIKQTWNGSEWSPSATPEHNDLPSEDFCRYTCKENYKWENGACTAETKTAACTGLPANAAWNGSGSVEQTWSGSSWAPQANGVHGDGTEGCYFKCIDENDKYEWKNNACAAMTKTGQACTGKPENSHWNGQYSQISQTWSGEAWLPSTTGSYSTTTDSKKCYFSCDENYTWNGSECVAAKRIRECSGLAANAQWNTVSSIEQTYQGGSEWLPSNAGTYGAATTTECHFICKDNYEWKNGECVGMTRTETCSGLLANAHWTENHSTVEQTWNGSQGWLPAAVGHHTSVSTEGCVFECDTNYKWENGACVGETRTNQACTGKPDSAVWNTVEVIDQTWNGSAWVPDLNATYNENQASNECRFKCPAYHNWNGTSCEPRTQIVSCGTLPSYAVWNTVSRITQTWNSTNEVWEPAVNLVYSETSSETECRFKCRENYEFANGECTAKKQTVACQGLPANAEWFYTTVEQTWNGTDWAPTTVGTYSADNNPGGCFFKCSENYNWNQTYRRCDPKTQSASCGEPPANAQWNVYNEITQTWSENGWTPSTAGVYNEIPSPNECRFRCNENYTWNGSVCAADTKQEPCTGLPAFASWWNMTINKIWNGTAWEPDTVESRHSENAVENPEYCYFKCNDNYTWDPDGNACVGKTQSADCDDDTLPQNAVWWNGGTVTQTWNGYGWIPTTIGSYKSDGAAGDGCYFKCKDYHYRWDQAYRSCDCADGYFWNGSECTSPCETAANTCGEHSVCKATSTDTFDCECESGYVSENLQCKLRRIWSFEDAWEDTSSGLISVDNSAEYHWVRSNALGAKTGKYAMCYNADNYHSEMTINVNMPEDGVVAFYIRGLEDTVSHNIAFALYVDGESDSDIVLTNRESVLLLTNGSSGDERTGWADWTMHSFTLTAGSHTLKFRYNGNNYQRFCIDDLMILPECSLTSGTPCIDPSSGMIWSAQQESVTWYTAVDYCGTYSESGLSSWHLPNISELRTIVRNCPNAETDGECGVIDTGDPSTSCLGRGCSSGDSCSCKNGGNSILGYSDYLWSSSSYEDNSAFAWTLWVNWSGVGSISKTASGGVGVRCTKDPCDEGYVWDGAKCVKQCTASLCSQSFVHSTGSCANDYACECNDGMFWNGSMCINPCSYYQPCNGLSHSNGNCSATAWNQYECGCDDGYAWNGSECVTECSSTSGTPCYDPASRLTWSSKVGGVNWQGAFDYCEDLNYGGFSDWRLPTISELRTLIQNCAGTITGGACAVVDTDSASCLSYNECTSNACINCSSGNHSKLGETDIIWSSSIDADDPDTYAWCVFFSMGMIESFQQISTNYVRCVR